jgi:hypothetical protein
MHVHAFVAGVRPQSAACTRPVRFRRRLAGDGGRAQHASHTHGFHRRRGHDHKWFSAGGALRDSGHYRMLTAALLYY